MVIPQRSNLPGKPVSPYQVDFDTINSWLRTCEQHHPNQPREPDEPNNYRTDVKGYDPVALRLVDVREQCIVEIEGAQPPRYLALSYVWGDVQQVQFTKLSRAVLEKKQALAQAELLRTIKML